MKDREIIILCVCCFLMGLILGNPWGSHSTRKTINVELKNRIEKAETKLDNVIYDNGLKVAE